MNNLKDILSKFGFPGLLIILSLILIISAATGGQNSLVICGLLAILLSSVIVVLSNTGVISVKLVQPLVIVIVLGAALFAYLDYNSVQEKLRFIAEQDRREAKVVQRLKDIRAAQVSYKKLYGKYAGSFDDLIGHVKNDSMPVIKAIGFVPDTLTEAKAVELGIVTRDTLLISVRDTLFADNYAIDSLRYVPFSEGKEFELDAGQIEKNKLQVQVFEAFADNGKILNGMNLSEEYIDLTEGLRVGSMTDPHTRGNWE